MSNSLQTNFELIEEIKSLKQKCKFLEESLEEKNINRTKLIEKGIESTKDLSILIVDNQLRYIYFNSFHSEMMKRAYGIEIEIGKNLLDYITSEEDKRKAIINYELALDGESHTTIQEYGLEERKYWENRYYPFRNEKDEIIGVSTFSLDITERKLAENLLRENSRRFRIAIDNFPYEFVILNPEFKVLYFNKLASSRYSKPFSEIIGSYINELDDKDMVEQSLELQNELILNKKSISKSIEIGSLEKKQYYKITYFPILDENGEIKEIFRISIDTTNLRKKETQLRAISNQLEKSREEERQRISRDIHDELGQILTALKIDLAWLKNHPPTATELPEVIEPIIALVDSAIDSARRVSFELRPGILDQTGLIPAMEWLINQLKKRKNIEFNLVFPQEIMANIEIDKSVTVYRIFQEILTNISRHSFATKVSVNLEITTERILLEVSDDGTGFDLNTHSESLGILGMQERARIQNGKLEVRTGLDKGTTIILSMPI